SLEAVAPAALERAGEALRLPEMKPGTVDRAFHARRARGKYHARLGVGELRFIHSHRQPKLVRVVRSAECDPLHAPRPLVGPQAARLQDAIDALHTGRGLDLRHQVEAAGLDAELALEIRHQPVDRM